MITAECSQCCVQHIFTTGTQTLTSWEYVHPSCSFLRVFSKNDLILVCTHIVPEGRINFLYPAPCSKGEFISTRFLYKLLHVVNFQNLKLPCADLEIASMVLTFGLLTFPDFSNKANQTYKPVHKLRTLSSILKKRQRSDQPPRYQWQPYVDCT